MRSLLRTVARLGLALASLGIALLAAEATARMARPHLLDGLRMSAFARPATRPGPPLELIPGAENPHFLGGPVRINADGLRGPELGEKGEQTRILAVGDSVTFGYGVPYEATFHAQLAALLRDEGHDAEAINAGVPSAGFRHYRRFLAERCADLDPDLVLINVVLNDIAVYKDPAPERAPTRRSLPSRLLSRSYLTTSLLPFIKGAAYATGLLDLNGNVSFAYLPLGPPTEKRAEAWRTSLAQLDATLAEAEACEVPAAVVVFPVQTQLDPDAAGMYRDRFGLQLDDAELAGGPQDRIAAHLAGRGVPVVDLRAALAPHPPEAMYLRSDHIQLDPIHLSVAGNRVAAEALREELAPWLPEGPTASRSAR